MLRLLLLCCVVVLFSQNAFADPPHGLAKDGKYWNVPCTVVRGIGQPVAYARAKLIVLDSQVIENPGLLNAFPKDTFVADMTGSFTLQIPRQITAEENPNLVFTPERIHLIIEDADGTVQAISGRISCGDDTQAIDRLFGGPTLLSKLKEPKLHVRVPAPTELVVQVLDRSGRLLQDARIGISHNLHAETRTGLGGEVGYREKTTGLDGAVIFASVCPTNIKFQISNIGEQKWVGTTLNGRYYRVPLPEITLPDVSLPAHLRFQGDRFDTGKKPEELGHAKVTIHVGDVPSSGPYTIGDYAGVYHMGNGLTTINEMTLEPSGEMRYSYGSDASSTTLSGRFKLMNGEAHLTTEVLLSLENWRTGDVLKLYTWGTRKYLLPPGDEMMFAASIGKSPVGEPRKLEWIGSWFLDSPMHKTGPAPTGWPTGLPLPDRRDIGAVIDEATDTTASLPLGSEDGVTSNMLFNKEYAAYGCPRILRVEAERTRLVQGVEKLRVGDAVQNVLAREANPWDEPPR